MKRTYQFWAKGFVQGVKVSLTGHFVTESYSKESDAFWAAAEGSKKLVEHICPGFVIAEEISTNLKTIRYPTLKLIKNKS